MGVSGVEGEINNARVEGCCLAAEEKNINFSSFHFCLFMLCVLSGRGVLPEAFRDSVRQPLQCVYCCSAAPIGS